MDISKVMKRTSEKYKDIINMEHHISKTRKPMSLYMRSAQFAPFAALTGYEDLIEETGRITDSKIDIAEDKIEDLNEKLLHIKEHMDKFVIIIYFEKDKRKAGGEYVTIKGKVRKIDLYKKIIYINDIAIKFKDILDINIGF